MEGSDACFAPVLTMTEAIEYAPNVERNVYTEVDEMIHPSPAPRFERTPSEIRHGTRALGADTASVLKSVGISDIAIQSMLVEGSAFQAETNSD